MARAFVMRTVLGVGVLVGLFGIPTAGPADPFVNTADAGPRAVVRAALRHQNHRLVVRGRHLKRDIRRDVLQMAHIRGTRHALHGALHPKRGKRK